MSERSVRQVAVIGSGVAGLTAAHVLGRQVRVTLFEADSRLGGHADTHEVEGVPIDTGFIVHNERTYPNLLRLFDELGVQTQDSDMSMSVRSDDTGLEWAGALGLAGLFPTWRNVLRPSYLRMLGEIPRFHRMARRLLATAPESGFETVADAPSSTTGGVADAPSSTTGGVADAPASTTEGVGGDETLGSFLERGGFSPLFRTHFMESLVACVWSCDPAVALDYPARYLFTFLQHHGMLQIFGSPQWRTVTGGSREYVARVAARLPDVRTGTKVTSVHETSTGVEVTDGNGRVDTFDAVVVATHPGQALEMLAEPTATQREVLSAMPYSSNTAQLHTDQSILPRNHRARASWNYLRRPSDNSRPVTVSYDMTRLMRLPVPTDGRRFIVTLGGQDLVDQGQVIETMEYQHPIYSPSSVAAQRRLPECDTDHVVFAGAWHGWGFHEDGARSGVEAAAKLGVEWGAEPLPTEATTYDTTIRHTRRKPFKRTFTHRSRTWLVDLDHLPDHGVLGRFEARDHLGAPDATIKANVENFLELNGVETDGGRIVMAANARALGYCFNPISVFWCHQSQRRPGRRGRRGAQHLRRPARLPRAPGRAGPGAHREAVVRLPVPRHRRLLRDRGAPAHRPAARLHHPALRRRRGLQRLARRRAHNHLSTAQRARRPARVPAHPGTRHLAVGPSSGDPPTTRPPATGRRLR